MIRFLALPIIFQALLIIHVVKAGRDRFWIYLLIFLPYAGGLAYVAIEVIPSFFTRQRMNRMGETAGTLFNPGGKLRKLEDQAGYSPTFRNICDVGDAYLEQGRFSDAAVMYKKALVPPFESNDEYLYKLAFARYKAGDFREALDVMAKLKEIGLGKLKPRELLLSALISENLGDKETAGENLVEATKKSSDLTYQVEYARFLRRCGITDEARKEFSIIIGTFDRLPRSFRKQYRSLMGEVRMEYGELAEQG